jgi:hypothetical protein
MSDTASSGAPAAAPSEPLPASDSSTAFAPVATTAPIGAFGTARGTGLARGKRPSQSAAPKAASSSPASYKPTSIEVITPQSEYKNPFASEQPAAAADHVPHVTPEAVTMPAFSFAPDAPEMDAGVTAPPVSFVRPTEPKAPVVSAPAATELFPLDGPATTPAPALSEEKPELKILPPAESKRAAQSWENGPSRDATPIFEPRARREERANAPAGAQPERRDHREPRQPRDPRDQKFDPREPRGDFARRDQRREQPRDPRDEQPSRAPVAAPKKSGGFFAWLKSLFSGPSATPATTTRDREDRGGGHEHRDGEHRQHRRRHRGGRGRGGFQGQPRDPRDGPSETRPEGGQPHQGGEGRGYPQGGEGFPRRRSRGGRGRSRNRDDRGGDPRPEGTQGGGNI